jgi:hypothetical protein
LKVLKWECTGGNPAGSSSKEPEQQSKEPDVGHGACLIVCCFDFNCATVSGAACLVCRRNLQNRSAPLNPSVRHSRLLLGMFQAYQYPALLAEIPSGKAEIRLQI